MLSDLLFSYDTAFGGQGALITDAVLSPMILLDSEQSSVSSKRNLGRLRAKIASLRDLTCSDYSAESSNFAAVSFYS